MTPTATPQSNLMTPFTHPHTSYKWFYYSVLIIRNLPSIFHSSTRPLGPEEVFNCGRVLHYSLLAMGLCTRCLSDKIQHMPPVLLHHSHPCESRGWQATGICSMVGKEMLHEKTGDEQSPLSSRLLWTDFRNLFPETHGRAASRIVMRGHGARNSQTRENCHDYISYFPPPRSKPFF